MSFFDNKSLLLFQGSQKLTFPAHKLEERQFCEKVAVFFMSLLKTQHHVNERIIICLRRNILQAMFPNDAPAPINQGLKLIPAFRAILQSTKQSSHFA